MASIPARDLGAVVLTGGSGTRLGGVDKAGLVVGDRSLLDRTLEVAGAVAGTVVVVGSQVPVSRHVRWTREAPPGGGPAAGLLAGVAALTEDWLLVLAVDMPMVSVETVARLRDLAEADGALLVDEDGRRQPLCAVYRRAALVQAAPVDPHGLPVRRLVAGLTLAEVPARPGEARDVDTPEQLDRIRAMLDRRDL